MGMAAGVAMGCPGVWLFTPNLFALTQNCIYPIWLFPRVFSFFEFSFFEFLHTWHAWRFLHTLHGSSKKIWRQRWDCGRCGNGTGGFFLPIKALGWIRARGRLLGVVVIFFNLLLHLGYLLSPKNAFIVFLSPRVVSPFGYFVSLNSRTCNQM